MTWWLAAEIPEESFVTEKKNSGMKKRLEKAMNGEKCGFAAGRKSMNQPDGFTSQRNQG
jgi:hypothetical protein